MNTILAPTFEQWKTEVRQFWIQHQYRAKARLAQHEVLHELYNAGNDPETALCLYKIIDAETYARHQDAIEGGASQLKNFSKSALNKFIQWSTSRYNEYKKADVVKSAYEMLALGEGVNIYTTGSYTEAGGCGGWNYLVNGPEHYIACGIGETVERFHEHARLQFEEVQG